VLEGRPVVGGNCVTEELTLPGFHHDSCGTAHVVIQDSPMVRHDELGLGAYGLEYIHPEMVVHCPFPDGTYLTQWHDLERTCAEFAKFSRKDAEAYRRLISEYEAVKPLFDAVSYTPVGWGKPIHERLAEHPDGKRWLRRIAMSGWEIIRDNFEDEHTRSFLMWMAFQTVVPPEWPMSGRLAYSLVYGRQRWSWCVPKGGSGAFSGALARLVEAHDGAILVNKRVARLVIENGRCVGVECQDGSTYRAEKAVLSTVHIKHLVDMAPRAAWGEDFVAGVETWAAGPTLFRHPLRHQRADALCGRGRHPRADGGRHPGVAHARVAHGLRLCAWRGEHRGPGAARRMPDPGGPRPRAARQAHHQDHRVPAL
jgi:phytoene dehydrogenase-like protein